MQAANRVMRRVTSEREYKPLAGVDQHKLQALDADNRSGSWQLGAASSLSICRTLTLPPSLNVQMLSSFDLSLLRAVAAGVYWMTLEQSRLEWLDQKLGYWSCGAGHKLYYTAGSDHSDTLNYPIWC